MLSRTIAISMIVLLAGMIFYCSDDNDNGTNIVTGDDLTADHLTAIAFTDIPDEYIELAKTEFNIFYVHTSHGSQIISGMGLLEDESDLYSFNNGDSSLTITEYSDDLGYDSDTSWVPITRQYLEANGSEINMVMWSWCGGVSSNSESGINVYLNKVNELEQDYPNVKFIYMTGHLDGTGMDGILYQRNNQIRQFCNDYDKILFDFADIESYDPDGNYYPDASDACEWCEDWCASHDCLSCDCAHSHSFNCYQKGKAFWWLLARIAGWSGD